MSKAYYSQLYNLYLTERIPLIEDITDYRNKQNPVKASDFRSNDKTQKRLSVEANKIKIKYFGGRRGFEYRNATHSNLIMSVIPETTAAQALAAFHQDPITAYNSKSKIWADEHIYHKLFSEHTTIEHIIFVYSLLRSIQEKKLEYQRKITAQEHGLKKSEIEQYEFLKLRSSAFLLTAAIANSLEHFLNKEIKDLFCLSFNKRSTTPNQGQKIWNPIVKIALMFHRNLSEVLQNGLKNNEEIKRCINNFCDIIGGTSEANINIYKKFSSEASAKKA